MAEKIADLVIIDDDQLFTSTLQQFLFPNKTVHCFHEPWKFLKEVTAYPKQTKICIDNRFNNAEDINGFVIAEKLHALGYTKLYLVSADNIRQDEIPSYLPMTAIFKLDIDRLKAILSD